MHEHIHWLHQYGYVGLFVLLAAGIVGIPVPDETLLTVAGYEAYQGKLDLLATEAAALLGSVAGITVSYWMGRLLFLNLIRLPVRLTHFTPEHIGQAQHWFARVGKWALVFGYFVPGVRHVTAIAAGMARLPMGDFAVFAYTGALVWSSTFVLLGYVFGKQWKEALTLLRLHRWRAVAAVLVVCLIAAAIAIVRKRRTAPNTPPPNAVSP